MNNVITDFLTEAVKRFLSKNPKFFRIINVILTITIIVTGLPDFIAQFGFELPTWATVLSSKVVAYAAIVGRILTQFTTTDKSILAKQNS